MAFDLTQQDKITEEAAFVHTLTKSAEQDAYRARLIGNDQKMAEAKGRYQKWSQRGVMLARRLVDRHWWMKSGCGLTGGPYRKYQDLQPDQIEAYLARFCDDLAIDRKHELELEHAKREVAHYTQAVEERLGSKLGLSQDNLEVCLKHSIEHLNALASGEPAQ